MAQPILLPAAEADLDTIWLSIATENPAAADRFSTVSLSVARL